jgi:hypothetical protein
MVGFIEQNEGRQSFMRIQERGRTFSRPIERSGQAIRNNPLVQGLTNVPTNPGRTGHAKVMGARGAPKLYPIRVSPDDAPLRSHATSSDKNPCERRQR